MDVLDRMSADDFEEIVVLNNNSSGLKGFIAIHDTTLGPALGGTRLWRYGSEEEALGDVMRLAQAMTLKASVAGLDCGGGKAVVMDSPSLKREAAFRALGKYVESLGGRFFTARDVGTTTEDIAVLRKETRWATDESNPNLGDLNFYTALGTLQGIRAGAAVGLKKDSLAGLTVAVQGAGAVGAVLTEMLTSERAKVLVAEPDPERRERISRISGVSLVKPEEIMGVKCDVLAPCALGGVINSETVNTIRAKVIAGCANNILADESLGDALAQRGLIYVPDFVINSGALIQGANFYLKDKRDNAADVKKIYDVALEILTTALKEGRSTNSVAESIALARLKRPKTYEHIYGRSHA
ncbi:MAG: Glu/Leu/Phe/Val dehydrogenase [Candidatus Eiseniibacteriota bacterium]|nr:MAG: Glu/Leu/Phe/Val dehydrogenase [Candidatus Eisenbacteria bacterium]